MYVSYLYDKQSRELIIKYVQEIYRFYKPHAY